MALLLQLLERCTANEPYRNHLVAVSAYLHEILVNVSENEVADFVDVELWEDFSVQSDENEALGLGKTYVDFRIKVVEHLGEPWFLLLQLIHIVLEDLFVELRLLGVELLDVLLDYLVGLLDGFSRAVLVAGNEEARHASLQAVGGVVAGFGDEFLLLLELLAHCNII